MKDRFEYTSYLMSHNIVVGKENADPKTAVEVCVALAKEYGIYFTKGASMATVDVYRQIKESLGCSHSNSFYQGFPQTVWEMNNSEKLVDQLLHYANTYGFGNFDELGHSLFETEVERTALPAKDVSHRYFEILTEEEAEARLCQFVNDLFHATRPLSDAQYKLVQCFIIDNNIVELCIADGAYCKDTLIKLTVDMYALGVTFDVTSALVLSDILKVAEHLNFTKHQSNLKHLKFTSAERKFISKMLDRKFEYYDNFISNKLKGNTEKKFEIKACYEKRQLWCGLLHNLHYKPKNPTAEKFVTGMHNGKKSVMSLVEKDLAFSPSSAAFDMVFYKGEGLLLRNLRYVLSRCKTDQQVRDVLSHLTDKVNPNILFQMMTTIKEQPFNRTFTFTKYNVVKAHKETIDERASRKSILPQHYIDMTVEYLSDLMKAHFTKQQIGKVYVDENMENIALPLFQATSSSGIDVLPTASVVPLPDDNTLRFFTYWEKVDDIDLSMIALDEDFTRVEQFSWMTMGRMRTRNNESGITFSGDQTSGSVGGSEFFDITLPIFRKKYPNARYLVACDNVYSDCNFSKVFCKAGYMIRSDATAGEVYEPKTVKTSFTIDADSRMAYLFAVDLKENKLIWLNVVPDSTYAVAVQSQFSALKKYIDFSKTGFNYAWLFRNIASEVVDNPEDAEIIVSDNPAFVESETQKVIRSQDVEAVNKYINA